MNTNGKAIEIITGRYGKGTADDNRIVDTVFGKNASAWFEMYFHWYNILHELGHGIMCFNDGSRPHPTDEEQLVNDFAVAFWRYYGEEEKINQLKVIVEYALSHLRCPAKPGVTHVEYALENWGTEELFNFNNYGWFQFSCVLISLGERKTLSQALALMGVKEIKPQPRKTFVYPKLNEDTISQVITDSVGALRDWGVVVPNVFFTLNNDPNMHMCNIVDL